VILYRCETWSLTLREDHILRLFENRVLRIFRPKEVEATGSCRKLLNKELHKVYSSSSINKMKSKRVIWAGHVARIGEKRNANRILMGKSKVKRQLRRRKLRWVDNIKMDLTATERGGMD
jgi:hypothetical protein